MNTEKLVGASEAFLIFSYWTLMDNEYIKPEIMVEINYKMHCDYNNKYRLRCNIARLG